MSMMNRPVGTLSNERGQKSGVRSGSSRRRRRNQDVALRALLRPLVETRPLAPAPAQPDSQRVQRTVLTRMRSLRANSNARAVRSLVSPAPRMRTFRSRRRREDFDRKIYRHRRRKPLLVRSVRLRTCFATAKRPLKKTMKHGPALPDSRALRVSLFSPGPGFRFSRSPWNRDRTPPKEIRAHSSPSHDDKRVPSSIVGAAPPSGNANLLRGNSEVAENVGFHAVQGARMSASAHAAFRSQRLFRRVAARSARGFPPWPCEADSDQKRLITSGGSRDKIDGPKDPKRA